MSSRLIGLGGFALSGKDAVATVLEDAGWARTRFSAAIEASLLAIDPWVPAGRWKRPRRYSELHAAIGFEESKKIPEVRRLCQVVGDDAGRRVLGENIWIDVAFRLIDAWMAEGRNAVVTGVRYANEVDAVKQRSGITVWVDRGLRPVNDHISDNGLSAQDFDVVIPNYGTLDDLAMTVRTRLNL
jgi:hypothetical protein